MKKENAIFPELYDKKEEVNFKKNFCLKYFDLGSWDLDVLNKVDVHLFDKKGNTLLYIESKYRITNNAQYREAIAQVILTNKKQDNTIDKVAIIYLNEYNDDVLELIDCSSDEVMYNNDINWKEEKASNPSRDAIDRINDRVKGKITKYKNEDIKEFYKLLKSKKNTSINITEKNYIVVYNQWKNEVQFVEKIQDEQDLINLFLIDLLNGTKYKKTIYQDYEDRSLFETIKKEREVESEQDLIREGTNLNSYRLMYNGEVIDGIKYQGATNSLYFTIKDADKYDFFWKTYKRPPEKGEFLKILERSNRLYSEKYRSDTGGEYTPICFVELQNEIIRNNYNLDEYIVCDPCAGVGNLENQFGKDYKQYCYLSTLEPMDVDTCKIKGFENVVRFDYLANKKQPQWKYKGTVLPINEICKRENRKLMIVMNPPYKHRKGFKYDMALEFFKKVLDLTPDVIVYYCKTEFFLRENTITLFENSNYRIVSHLFSNAKDTFKLHGWPVSQVIFDKEKGEEINRDNIVVKRFELNKKEDKLEYIKTYVYNSRPSLIANVEDKIKENASGLVLGQWTNQNYCIVLSNRHTHNQFITTNNLKYALVLKGINFNTHGKYFETSNLTFKGKYEDITKELESDAIIFSLFYKGNNFSNKEGVPNFFVPFTAEELGCEKNDLNVYFTPQNPTDLFSSSEEVCSFDFREFIAQFELSEEARALYLAALEICKYYHTNNEYIDKNYNDSFYDITNAIMGKDVSKFETINEKNDRRITKVKTTKGTKGFSRTNIPFVIPSKDLHIFNDFFDKRDILAKKINKQLLDANILLWERENIY